jgi:hypothetical protein
LCRQIGELFAVADACFVTIPVNETQDISLIDASTAAISFIDRRIASSITAICRPTSTP